MPPALPLTLPVRAATGGVLLDLRISPGASRTTLGAVEADAAGVFRLRLRVAAPPVDGAANKAVTAFLAKALHLRKQDCVLTKGAKARSKTFLLKGNPSDVRARIEAWIGEKP